MAKKRNARRERKPFVWADRHACTFEVVESGSHYQFVRCSVSSCGAIKTVLNEQEEDNGCED